MMEARMTKSFPAGPESAAFDLEVHLSVEPGITVLFGPSGSGKTLLLRALAYLDPWDRGSLLWNGAELTRKTVPLFRSQA